ncbi:ferrochelatase [Alteromonas lipolytica]|uniref:Ferrochelatase n=1 Tax=Alteromonas lipolytica TaxID=1856405 RepID=A0A1E8F8Z7_9ALTE|nr:ferrochelatase [Alteromonas lipolytica]OFI32380.1 ferrochelatase [Alteromonas lipolytica]GGF86603.1 ferrochelatase 2 [Alteromonas lipolytica]
MKYAGNAGFSHQQADKIGVVITNLGTPEAPTKAALKPYLKEFLSDPRVVEVPRLIWWFILNGIILNIRPKRSAQAYASVWSEDGSPLMVHTKAQARALAERCEREFGDNVVVDYAMRYGEPAVNKVIEKMLANGVRKLLVVPLYPQYSASTVGSTFDAIASDFVKRRWLPDFRFVSHYHDRPGYIKAVADSIRQHWDAYGRADRLILSYHGVPKRYLLNGDPYHCECLKTSRLIAEELGMQSGEYMTTFQSRFGREEWLKPYTDETLKALPAEGVKSVQVVCPGFSADCLETIEEIGEENRDYFMEAGGERYEYIPALNSEPAHIKMLFDLVKENLHGWQVDLNVQQRAELASKHGCSR